MKRIQHPASRIPHPGSSKIAVALSGGVDSLTAGFLLKEQGLELFGVHFVTGYEKDPGTAHCPDPVGAAEERIRPLADRLGIDLLVVDVRKAFEKRVVAYFRETYRRGKTPNPCLVCNPVIKFQTVFDQARKHGAEKLATGHYARIAEGARLLRGIDRKKDQSYFLAFLTRRQLDAGVFPLGEMTKDEVKKRAAAEGLVPAVSESQDVCFIQDGDYKRFLSDGGAAAEPGPVVDLSGRKLGSHRGLHRFTVGQRKGIRIPAARPYYVVRLEREENRLVVGFKEDLLSDRCRVESIQWPEAVLQAPFQAETRIRYRHRAAPSTVTPTGPDTAEVLFDEPQSAVTPGQGAVFYQGEEVLGAGFIV